VSLQRRWPPCGSVWLVTLVTLVTGDSKVTARVEGHTWGHTWVVVGEEVCWLVVGGRDCCKAQRAARRRVDCEHRLRFAATRKRLLRCNAPHAATCSRAWSCRLRTATAHSDCAQRLRCAATRKRIAFAPILTRRCDVLPRSELPTRACAPRNDVRRARCARATLQDSAPTLGARPRAGVRNGL
jgi:hypothetical protein